MNCPVHSSPKQIKGGPGFPGPAFSRRAQTGTEEALPPRLLAEREDDVIMEMGLPTKGTFMPSQGDGAAKGSGVGAQNWVGV